MEKSLLSSYKEIAESIKENSLLAFVGAGGKTTTMFRIAEELKKLGKRVLVTTTTKILFPDEDKKWDTFVFDCSAAPEFFGEIKSYTITCLGCLPDFKSRKIIGVGGDCIDGIFKAKIFDCILVEADGAKCKPIKAPAEYEPVLPKFVTTVFGVIGLDAIGTVIAEKNVHRSEIFSSVTDSILGETIDENILCNLILSKKGLFAKTPVTSEKILLLNKAVHSERVADALKIAEMVEQKDRDISVMII